MKYKVGDKVIITGNSCGHGFEDGEVVVISAVTGTGSDNMYRSDFMTVDGVDSWYLDDDDCELYKEAPDTVTSAVDHPPHYGQGSIECIEYVEDFLTKEEYIGYLRGNIAKYMHRFRYKNGVEDVEKARWYMERLIKKLREE